MNIKIQFSLLGVLGILAFIYGHYIIGMVLICSLLIDQIERL